ncbi:MAG TPA: DUF456 domain-containing protein [Acidimicrobiales bacterium]|jgi:uncharacterized protein|nr:DUF456 domain-containing protein [Acidimicrobiales bacterium]
MTALLVALAMLVGLIGTVVPLIPGLTLIAGAAVVYGLVEGFGTVGVVAMIVIAVLAVAGTLAGIVLPHRAAGGAGASRSSLLVGVVGAVIGFFVVPVVGLPIGGALGIYLGERMRTGEHPAAWRATAATLKGFGVGALVQVAAGILMIATWGIWAVAG